MRHTRVCVLCVCFQWEVERLDRSGCHSRNFKPIHHQLIYLSQNGQLAITTCMRTTYKNELVVLPMSVAFIWPQHSSRVSPPFGLFAVAPPRWCLWRSKHLSPPQTSLTTGNWQQAGRLFCCPKWNGKYPIFCSFVIFKPLILNNFLLDNIINLDTIVLRLFFTGYLLEWCTALAWFLIALWWVDETEPGVNAIHF